MSTREDKRRAAHQHHDADDERAKWADAERLGAEWDVAFAALRQAGLEADSGDPIAVRYRAASDAVNHANRKLDFLLALRRESQVSVEVQ